MPPPSIESHRPFRTHREDMGEKKGRKNAGWREVGKDRRITLKQQHAPYPCAKKKRQHIRAGKDPEKKCLRRCHNSAVNPTDAVTRVLEKKKAEKKKQKRGMTNKAQAHKLSSVPTSQNRCKRQKKTKTKTRKWKLRRLSFHPPRRRWRDRLDKKNLRTKKKKKPGAEERGSRLHRAARERGEVKKKTAEAA